MEFVKVYKFKVYDIVNDIEKVSNHYATLDYIKKIDGARALEESEIEVSTKNLSDGLYVNLI